MVPKFWYLLARGLLAPSAGRFGGPGDAGDQGGAVVAAGLGGGASEFGPDQFCEGTLSSAYNPANGLEVNVRTNLATRARYGFLHINATGQSQLKYDGISPGIVLAAGPGPALGPGDSMRVEVLGTTIRGLVNGIEVLTATDSSLTAGAASLAMVPRAGVPAAYFESWSGGIMP